jgi:hypothetical protein
MKETRLFQRARNASLLALLALANLAVLGCNRAGPLPTAASPSERGHERAERVRDVGVAQGAQRFGPSSWPPHAVIPEVCEALGAILTGEQVYLQRFGTFTDAADTAAIRTLLDVHLDAPSCHWAFSVTDASVTGFLASAHGRDGTEAAGFTVTLGYVRGQPLAWSVTRSRPGR